MCKVVIVCVFMMCFLSGCSNNELSPRNYIAWVNNERNGLKVDHNVGDYLFILQFEPVEYTALREQYSGKFTKAEFEQNIKERNDFQYFILSIANKDGKTDMLKTGIKSSDEYYSRIQYFSYLMQQDISLIDGVQTFPCELFQFERDYGVTPFQKFILGFPKRKNPGQIEDKTLVYNDKVLGIKKVEIKIKGSDIKKLPQVKID